jgi:RNA polymerase sigma factor (sigma-70 family)
MATAQLTTVVRCLRRLVDPRDTVQRSDGQLLDSFITARDETSFATLVLRHGPLVLSVCRRVLGDRHDAEDAFQAAFLVLARKASAIRKRDSVGSWLFGVAYRLASQLRLQTARRRRHEQNRDASGNDFGEGRAMRADPASESSDREVRAVLDSELARLPEKYRSPVVLCYLEGRSNTEAAELLGWAVGTVKSRLTHARQLLRTRLARRGVSLTIAAMVALLGDRAATAALPPALASTTTQAAIAFALGQTAGAASAKVVALASGMLRTVLTSNIKLAMVSSLAVVLVGLGALGLRPVAHGGRPTPSADEPKSAAAGEKPNLDQQGDPLPAGALARLGTTRLRHGQTVNVVRFMPDGKSLITVAQDGAVRRWDVATGKELRRFSLSNQPTGVPSGGFGGVVMVGGGFGGGGMAIGYSGMPRVALSADCALLAAQGYDGKICFWDVSAGKELRHMDPPDGGLLSLELSSDGKHLGMRLIDSSIRVHETATGKLVREFGKKPQNAAGAPGGPVIVPFDGGSSLVFSRDAKLLAFTKPNRDDPKAPAAIEVCDTTTGKELCRIQDTDGEAQVGGISFSPDGKILARTRFDGTIRLADATNGKELRQLKSGNQQAIAGLSISSFIFTPDSKTIITRSTVDNSLIVWDVATGKELHRFARPTQAGHFVAGYGDSSGMAVSPDGKLLALGSENHSIHLIDIATGKEVGAAGGHRSAISNVRYAPDGKTVTTVGEDGTVRIWDTANGKELRQQKMPEGTHLNAISADGRMVAVQQYDGAIHIWDVTTGKELAKFGDQKIGMSSLAFAPDRKTLAVHGLADEKIVIILYDTATGKERRRIAVPAPAAEENLFFSPHALTGVIFTPDGKTLASLISPHLLGVWDAMTGKELAHIEAPQKRSILGAAFTPDSRSLALDLGDDILSVCELATGKERRKYGKSTKPDVALPAPGGGIAVAGAVAVPAGGFGGGPMLHWTRPAPGAAVSHDGRMLAQSRTNGAVSLYDTRTGKEIEQYKGHQGSIDALAFAPDGKTLTTVSRDTTGLIWDLTRLKAGVNKADSGEVNVEALWNDLAGDDAARAYDAICALGTSAKTISYFKDRLRPAAPPDADKINRLIADLDSEQFAVRKKAGEELLKTEPTAAPLIQNALEGDLSPEARKRLQDVLARLTAPTASGETLRSLRAIEVLEMIGTPEARTVLERVAQGTPGAAATIAAKESLKRIDRK